MADGTDRSRVGGSITADSIKANSIKADSIKADSIKVGSIIRPAENCRTLDPDRPRIVGPWIPTGRGSAAQSSGRPRERAGPASIAALAVLPGCRPAAGRRFHDSRLH
jgi:hypothetical protein